MGRASGPSPGSLVVGANGEKISFLAGGSNSLAMASGDALLINLDGGDTSKVTGADFDEETKVISIIAIGGAIHHRLGSASSAMASDKFDPYLPAGLRRYFPIYDGDDRLAVVRASGVVASVNIYITEHAKV